MRFSIADRNSNAGSLARLFSANLTTSYISHGELQGSRALALGKWAPDIESILRHEIGERMREPLSEFPRGQNWLGVVQAFERDELVGLAFVTIVADARVPYGVLEDVVIDGARRGAGLGEQFIRWILDRFEAAGIERTFLESGFSNNQAHHLFERLGYKTTSIVMMREG